MFALRKLTAIILNFNYDFKIKSFLFSGEG